MGYVLDNGVTPARQRAVTLTKPNGETITTMTSASGFYRFDGLAEGTYKVNTANFPQHNVIVTAGNVINIDFPAKNGYTMPVAVENFESNTAGSTLDTQGWFGAGPAKWEVKVPLGSANSSNLAIRPIASAFDARTWRRSTASTGIGANDAVVVSAMLFAATNSIAGFAPANTANASPIYNIDNTGPYFSLRADGYSGFWLRGVLVNGNSYKATNLAPLASKWYEIQVVVDPTRTIPGSPSGFHGAAKIYVRNVTDGGSFQRLIFDNSATTAIESLDEVPLWLSSANNPRFWNGWQILGLNSGAQIDNLRMFLYPFADYQSGGAVLPALVGQ